MSGFNRSKFADVMEDLGKKHLKFGTPAVEEIRKKFYSVFGKGKWPWCAATVTYAAEHAGLPMPIKAPSKWGYTFALVEAWQQWAKEKGFYYDNDGKFVPERGDISLFDWSQKSIDTPDADWEDHIGCHLRMDGKNYICAEGNTGGQTNIKERTAIQIQGWVRIPDGFTFDGVSAPAPEAPTTEEKKALQRALNGMNVNPQLTVDGEIGPKTKAALRSLAD